MADRQRLRREHIESEPNAVFLRDSYERFLVDDVGA